jgi:hypothetical protein
MAYSGYMLKFGTTEFPNRYINAGTYVVTPLAREIISDEATADGVHHITLSPHERSVIEFSLNGMSYTDIATALNYIVANYTDAVNRSISVTYHEPISNTYKTGSFRVADFSFGAKLIRNNKVWFNDVAVRLEEY